MRESAIGNVRALIEEDRLSAAIHEMQTLARDGEERNRLSNFAGRVARAERDISDGVVEKPEVVRTTLRQAALSILEALSQTLRGCDAQPAAHHVRDVKVLGAPATVDAPAAGARADEAPRAVVGVDARPGAEALALWREKLERLLEAEAVAHDAAQKFGLSKEIEHARARIRELGG